MFGPNVFVRFDPKSRLLEAVPLKGAGTVERSLASLVNGTQLMDNYGSMVLNGI